MSESKRLIIGTTLSVLGGGWMVAALFLFLFPYNNRTHLGYGGAWTFTAMSICAVLTAIVVLLPLARNDTR